VRGDRRLQLLIELPSMLNTPVPLVSNHGLDGLEDLNRCLETDEEQKDRHCKLTQRAGFASGGPTKQQGQAL
jgi:hypothetical protein